MLDDIFIALGLSKEESKTYLILTEIGASTAGDLAKRMGIPRPSVYGFLKKLLYQGVISESQKNGIKVFSPEKPEAILQLFNTRIDQLNTQKEEFARIIPDLESRAQFDAFTPHFEMFEGKNGVQHVLQDMLLYSGIETRSYWPMQAMVDILGGDFFHRHNKSRIMNKTSVKAIWPSDYVVSVAEHPSLGAGQDYLREIRIAPPSIHFSMGYWIYKDKTAFLSSKSENFGFIIESRELAEMLTSQHELMWINSTPLKIPKSDMQPFISEIRKENL